MLTSSQQVYKRIFDVLLCLIILPVVIIPMGILICIARVSTGMNGLFSQIRIGKNARPFRLYKIRTLKGLQHESIREITENKTVFGNWLRKTKLDELPQLYNILIGDMSWVGPRPDVPGYADLLSGEDRIVLSIRPGLTGPATIKYKDEDRLLLAQEDPQDYNDNVIWPDKVEINKQYIKNWSLLKDIKYILASV
ncbi:MAG: sugar transferase [Flavobacterium sp.]|nr:MAG: sugar transferase [Flavobacterium sp.]